MPADSLKAQSPPPRADLNIAEDRLAAWMQTNVPDFRGPVTVELIAGGQSNPTYRVITPDRKYVLRRQPPGPILKGAHAVDREYRVMAALAGSGVPVPRMYGLCMDNAVIGTNFYLMEFVDGRIIWDMKSNEVPQAQRHAHFDAMSDVIARLHAVDYTKVGLTDFGRPGNFVGRQVIRWSKQYMEDTLAGRDENLDRLVQWLPDHLPKTERTCLIHGDYRCDNMIFHRDRPEIIAVLDWELSTVGDPLADLVYHTMVYRLPADVLRGLRGADFARLDIPTEEEYVEAYCRRMGIDDIPDYEFYMVFNLFRFVAICHGIKGRLLRGTAVSEQAKTYAGYVEPLAALAWDLTAKVK
jgi:aminoglycoside phosphotransferase (APT) family kinase protein